MTNAPEEIITASQAISHPDLLGPSFSGDTWATWRAVLKAAEGEPLDEAERALFNAIAGGREPPKRRVKELVVIAGRRSGKDSIASAIATAAAVNDYRAFLRPGERASVVCLAVDREQAGIVHRYIGAYFDTVPMLARLVSRRTGDVIELKNRVDIVISTNSYRSVRGKTVCCAVFDEAAFWRDQDSASPDIETYNAVMPAMATLPNAMLVIITTAYRKTGLAYQKWAKHFEKDDDDILVVYGSTRLFNPTISQATIDAAIAQDPEAGEAEYNSLWRTDLSDWAPRDVVEAVVVANRHELLPQPGIDYIAATDVSGGTSDSMSLAIAHIEADGRIVLDLLRENPAPFNAENVTAEYAEICRRYNVGRVIGDRYGGEWPRQASARYGVSYEVADRTKSDFYRDLLPLITGRQVELLSNLRLVNQLCALERRAARGGRDSIDHPPGGHDDVANAAAIALVMASTAPARSLWHPTDLLTGDAPLSVPRVARTVFASAAVDFSGLAVFYWARSFPPRNGAPDPTVLIDFDLSMRMTPALFPSIRDQLHELSRRMHAENKGLITTAALAAQASMACQPEMIEPLRLGNIAAARRAELITNKKGSDLLADREALAQAAAMEIGAGRIKIAVPAHEKSKHSPLPLFAFRAGTTPDAATDAALIGIGATLDSRTLPYLKA